MPGGGPASSGRASDSRRLCLASPRAEDRHSDGLAASVRHDFPVCNCVLFYHSCPQEELPCTLTSLQTD